MTAVPTPPAAGDAAPFPAPTSASKPAEAPTRLAEAEQAELRRQGAKAAARGQGSTSNPMLEPINLPESTGESKLVWSGRRDAWQQGHVAQGSSSTTQAPSGSVRAAVDRRALDEALFGVTRVLTFAGSRTLTSASGFFFERDDRLFLVTSRHVLFDGPSEHAPDRIEIEVHTDARDLTRMTTFSILLHRDGLSVWREAHDSGGEVDVATLELERGQMPHDSVLRPFGPAHLATDFELFAVGDRLAIPGFPLGFFDTVHHLPVVRQAAIASSFGIRFQGQGFFLTDARMHRGSSGSPVLALLDADAEGRPRRCLLGVHSSRMDMATRDEELDESLGLNCAWYADILLALTEPEG